MKSAIIYYSFSGNTKKVAESLGEYLKGKGDVEILELQALDESEKFLGQCRRAFRHQKAQIASVKFDLSGFDLVCFGSPVWAFGPAPAMNTYLDNVTGIENKQIVLFTTCGSGTGNNRCLKFMQDILAKKGTNNFKRFSIQQFKVKDQEYVRSEIDKLL